MVRSFLLGLAFFIMPVAAFPQAEMPDTITLKSVHVYGKNRVRRVHDGAFNVNAIRIGAQANTLTDLNTLLDRSTGVRVRREGGLGADIDLSINGLSGNAVRYFIDGVPLETRGAESALSTIPVNIIHHVEVYKGVVPAYLGTDALGGAVNIVTKKSRNNFVDASVTGGSFNTLCGDFSGRFVLQGSGLVLQPSFRADYSKNNYTMKDIELWDEETGRYVNRQVKRFHDAYRSWSGQLEAGIENKSWTDACFVSFYYNGVRKELQTGQTQSVVYGEAERRQDRWSVSARYRKEGFLLPRLALNAFVSFTHDHSLVVDSAYRKYRWDRTYITTTRNEITGRARQLRHIERPLLLLRTNWNYKLSATRSLNLNYVMTRQGNRRRDDLDTDFVPTDDRLTKHVIGLSFDQQLMDGRWVNMVFLKDYINHVNIRQNDLSWITNAETINRQATKHYPGYGIGSRFTFSPLLSLKASFEHTARLPLARELLGNGTTVYANLALRPETGNNVNAGLYGEMRFGGDDHSIGYDLSAFYRHVKDFIYPVLSASEGMLQYDNVRNVDMKGVEGELKYRYRDFIELTTNLTYQKSVDQNRYKADGKPSVTYRNDVPNRPWLFGNAELSITRRDLFGIAGTALRFDYNYHYTHWFFLTWEGYGALSSKDRIPTQHIHTASITYSWKQMRYNLSLECDNLFDRTAFDNFRMQKPGRQIMCKFRLFIH